MLASCRPAVPRAHCDPSHAAGCTHVSQRARQADLRTQRPGTPQARARRAPAARARIRLRTSCRTATPPRRSAGKRRRSALALRNSASIWRPISSAAWSHCRRCHSSVFLARACARHVSGAGAASQPGARTPRPPWLHARHTGGQRMRALHGCPSPTCRPMKTVHGTRLRQLQQRDSTCKGPLPKRPYRTLHDTGGRAGGRRTTSRSARTRCP